MFFPQNYRVLRHDGIANLQKVLANSQFIREKAEKSSGGASAMCFRRFPQEFFVITIEGGFCGIARLKHYVVQTNVRMIIEQLPGMFNARLVYYVGKGGVVMLCKCFVQVVAISMQEIGQITHLEVGFKVDPFFIQQNLEVFNQFIFKLSPVILRNIGVRRFSVGSEDGLGETAAVGIPSD